MADTQVGAEAKHELTLEHVKQFFPNGEKDVPDALAYLHALETLALRQMRGYETTQSALARATKIPKSTIQRYLTEMERAGLIYTEGEEQGRNYYVDLNRFNSSENAAHLTAKVKAIIHAANQLAKIQNTALSA